VTDQDGLQTKVNRLVDRAAISDLFSQFAAGTDVQDWELVADCFAPDAVLDLSRPVWDGTKDQMWVGRDDVMSNLKKGISRHFVGHHMVTNHRCVIDGDRARAVAYLRSSHLDDPERPTDHEDHGAWYLTEFTRVDGGWKFAYLKPVSVWWTAEAGSHSALTDDQLAEMRDYLSGVEPIGAGERTRTNDEDLASKVRWLDDRDAITDLFSRFAACGDVQDWEALTDCFSPDIVIDRSRPTWDGQKDDAWIGREQVMEHVKADSSKHYVSHHMVTNHRCVIDGDRARAVAYLHSTHVDDPERPADHYAHGAWYLTELTREGGRWRFSYLKHIPVWWPSALRPDGPVTESQRNEMRDYLAALRTS
jgi:IS5 family transposase